MRAVVAIRIRDEMAGDRELTNAITPGVAAPGVLACWMSWRIILEQRQTKDIGAGSPSVERVVMIGDNESGTLKSTGEWGCTSRDATNRG